MLEFTLLFYCLLVTFANVVFTNVSDTDTFEETHSPSLKTKLDKHKHLPLFYYEFLPQLWHAPLILNTKFFIQSHLWLVWLKTIFSPHF